MECVFFPLSLLYRTPLLQFNSKCLILLQLLLWEVCYRFPTLLAFHLLTGKNVEIWVCSPDGPSYRHPYRRSVKSGDILLILTQSVYRVQSSLHRKTVLHTIVLNNRITIIITTKVVYRYSSIGVRILYLLWRHTFVSLSIQARCLHSWEVTFQHNLLFGDMLKGTVQLLAN